MVAISQADAVVFEVQDNYQKQTYRNRAYISHSGGKMLLGVPIIHLKDNKRKKTSEICVENEVPWLYNHWKSLQTAYRTSPFFEYYEEDLAPLFKKEVTSLLDFNMEIIEVLLDLIGIDVSISKTTEFHKNPEQLDGRFLADAKKEKDHGFETYHQVFENVIGFIPNLSVLDLLFNEGPNTISYLESQKLDLE
ncbi:hypothetical protein ULMA_11140 [Patiriisocius marinus]|uniref:WbqC-like protein family protein n=2 Tax=Patiriisocius marinus TaxID=1397112 RepID=A0A5J4IVX1_9FLAO|nr:hypothetical protein ULMA_11140 [Patiriisocius marinus]